MTTSVLPAPMGVADARGHFVRSSGYLAACTQGLPLRETLAASRAELALWESADMTPAYYGEAVAVARASFARLVAVATDRVAIGSQVSALVSMAAASAPDGAEILCAEGDFSSVIAPFTAQAHRGVRVVSHPLETLPSAIGANTWMVAFSAVQSATGHVADSAAIAAAAACFGTRTLVDLTQSAGWLPVDASRFDLTVCHAYKWLCAPRGSAFLTVSDRMLGELRPTQAGWFAGDDPWNSCYGAQIELAGDARRFDVSPAWPVWPGTAAAVGFFAALDIEEVRAYVCSLGMALSDRLGIRSLDQPIVTWPDPNGAALSALTLAGIRASGRAGRARVAFHLWNTEDDVERVAGALGQPSRRIIQL